MRIVAVLLPGVNQPRITDAEWESFVQSRAKPASSTPRVGINPFTKKPMVLPPKPHRGLEVVKEGKAIGSIEWAQDGSNMLLVRQEEKGDAHRRVLLETARDVASCLGLSCDVEHDMVRFSRDDDYVSPPESPLEKALRLWNAGDGEGAAAHYMATFNVDLRTAVRELKDLAPRGSRPDR